MKRICLTALVLFIIGISACFFYPGKVLGFMIRSTTGHELSVDKWKLSLTGENLLYGVLLSPDGVPAKIKIEELAVDIKEKDLLTLDRRIRAQIDLSGVSSRAAEERWEIGGFNIYPALADEKFSEINFQIYADKHGVWIDELKAVSGDVNLKATLSYMYTDNRYEIDLSFWVSPEKAARLPEGLKSLLFYEREDGWWESELRTSFKMR